MERSAIIEKAQKFAAKGQLEKAIDEWHKLIQETPNDGNIFNTIGDLQLKRSFPQKAVEAYLKASDAFQIAGFELKAIAVCKKVIKIDSSRLDVCEKLADLNGSRGLTANAIDEYYRVAKQYAKLGNMKSALQVYQKIANLDVNNVQARIKLADMCVKEGFNDQALDAYKNAFEFYRSRDKKEEAEGILEQIHKLEPDLNAESADQPESMSPETIDTPKPVEDSEEGTMGSSIPSFVETPSLPAVEESRGEVSAPLVQRSETETTEAPISSGEAEAEPIKRIGSQDASLSLDGQVKAETSATPIESEGPRPIEESPSFGNIEIMPPALLDSQDASLSFDGEVRAGTSSAPTESQYTKTDSEPKSFDTGPGIIETPQESIVADLGETSASPIANEEGIDKEHFISQDQISFTPDSPRLNPEELQNRMTEAEVYLKYGLLDKAREQFFEVINAEPDYVEAYIQLKEIYVKEGKDTKTVEVCQTLIELFGKLGETDRKKEIEEELNLLSRSEPEISESGEILVREEESGSLSELTPQVDESSFPPSAESDPFASLFGEGEEYLKSGRRKDARRTFIKILELEPDHPDARKRLLEIEEIEDQEAKIRHSKPQAPPQSSEPVLIVNDKESVDEASFEGIDAEFEKSFSDLTAGDGDTEKAPGAEPIMDMVEKRSNVEEGDGSVDLTSFLEGFDDQRQRDIDAPSSSMENALDTIFEEFQRGFNDQSLSEDVETHFNLGIAYREMGLFDDALTEFRQAMTGERYVDSALMLSICYHQKGMEIESEEHLRSLLDDSRCSNEQRLLVKYELALILEKWGRASEAQKLFEEIYSSDPKFRDVAGKVCKKDGLAPSEPKGRKRKRISYI